MKQFVCSVPAILVTSVATLSMIALAGCGSSGKGNSQQALAAKHVYVLQTSHNDTTEVEQDSVAVFSASSTGDATPTSTLTLPDNFSGYALAIGPSGEIYVGGEQYDPSSDENNGEILEYPASSSGSVMPKVTLNGSANSFDYPSQLAVNSAGTLFVSAGNGSLEAFASGFTASSAPTQYLTWGMEHFEDSGDYLAADTAGDIFYMDVANDEVDVFVAGAMGAAAPARTITGTDTASFDGLEGIAADGAGNLYLATYNSEDDPNNSSQPGRAPGNYAANKRWGTSARLGSHLRATPHIEGDGDEPTEIIEFAAGAKDTPTPLKRIGGSATHIVEPLDLAIDAASNLYYLDANGNGSDDLNPLLLEVFSSSASGNVAPTASMTTTNLTIENTNAVAIN